MSDLKTYYFSGTSLAVTANGNLAPVYSAHPIQGELVRVDTDSRAAGSVWLYESGTNLQLLRNNAPSGTATVVTFPRQNISDANLTRALQSSVSGNVWTPAVTNVPLLVGGSGWVSGDFVRMTAWYR